MQKKLNANQVLKLFPLRNVYEIERNFNEY